ncbi:MAG: hypothetical protein CL866_06985 [Cycloclasticus sp.]|nr:hypothetical protein [Cycloclasticus sp.]MBG96598.1 hypothetical protein [Cycloclasticus sp.]HAI97859.1 hypothetical protein [Methylococcaceae bacterium]|tara:strand:- start:521 stop:748 length:228 start_codon:yes stop_codon:yes gene_type:complete
MADILQFKKKKRPERQKGQTLCRNGHHIWVTDKQKKFDVKQKKFDVKQKKFDVKQGKLVTLFRCQRCGKNKLKLI